MYVQVCQFNAALQWRLSLVLTGVPGLGVPRVDTCVLVDKNGELVPGELQLECTVLDPETGLQVGFAP